MDEKNGEANGSNKNGASVASNVESPATEVREFYHSQFAGISTIWPESVCGH